MSTDYTYDEQGQFFPFFVLTVTGLITLPLTYTLLKPSQELEKTASRIRSDYVAPQNDLIQNEKRRQKKRERRLKRIVITLLGYAVMAWMVYLIIVTQRIIPKIWDPYDILGISRVRPKQYPDLSRLIHCRAPMRKQSVGITSDYLSSSIQIRSGLIRQKMKL